MGGLSVPVCNRGWMPRRSVKQRPPCEYTYGEFLDGDVYENAPPGVIEMLFAAQALRNLLDTSDWTIKGLAEAAEVDRSVLHDVLAGRVYINVLTLARLEAATIRSLWPAQ